MDALRKAEQQKQLNLAHDGPAGAGVNAQEPTLDPSPEQAMGSSRPEMAAERGEGLPELPKRLEELDEQFLSLPPASGKRPTSQAGVNPPRTPTGRSGEDSARAGAQNLFSAKQSDPPIRSSFAIGVGIATLLAVLAIGAYFYWQLQPKGGVVLNLAARPSPSSPSNPSVPENVAVTLPSAPATDMVAKPLPPSATDRLLKPKPSFGAASATKSGSGPASEDIGISQPPQQSRRQENVPLLAAGGGNAIRLSKQTAIKVDDAQEAAYAAFTQGKLESARTLWMKVLRNDSRNLNALLGLATLAQQEGKADLAMRFYRQAVEVDPKDPVANAGLLALEPPSDPRLAESRLKALLVEHPDSAPLYFALGNLYLGEARWAEAQQAFFKAHVAEPGNADYLYNLAVSLDHLHQEHLAAEYYAQALSAAGAGPAAFDRTQAEARLKALQAFQRQ